MTRTMLLSLGIAVAVSLSAQEAPRKAQPEAMSPEQFSEAHSVIFQPDPSQKVGAITNRIAPGTASAVAQAPLPQSQFHRRADLRQDGARRHPACRAHRR